MENLTEAQAIANLSATPIIAKSGITDIAFIPNGNGNWDIKSLEYLGSAPARKKGTVVLNDVESFISYTKVHGSLSDSAIYIDADYSRNHISAVAVFNDHSEKNTGWQDFKASFSPKQTQEWEEWIKHNNQIMSQIDFSNFFERNITDFANVKGKPSGGDVLTFITQLQETRTVKYGSAVNLQNGMVQIEFVENNEKAQKGKLEMFKEFSLGISPFINGEAYQIDAFLRYRISRESGDIKFWYELKKPEKILESACEDLIKNIKEKTGIPVYFGKI